jgi:hypothetical protein
MGDFQPGCLTARLSRRAGGVPQALVIFSFLIVGAVGLVSRTARA